MKRLHGLLALASAAVMSSFAVQANDLSGEELFGALTARQIGPAVMSGRISDLEMHPTNPRVIYAGTAGGGVWRSLNGGASFLPIFDTHAQSIGVIKLDPKKPDQVIWVGTGETWTRNSVGVGDGLYKSTDGGTNWNKVGFDGNERIADIAIHPKDTNVVYVCVLGALWGDSDQRGVYQSKDGGASWNKLLYVNEQTGCSDLVMDPKNPDVLYAAMWQHRRTAWSFSSGGEHSALYKTSDAGKTWKKLEGGIPEGKLGRIAIAVAPSDANRVYIVLETEKDEQKGLYRSDDAGKTFRHVNGDFGLVVRPFYFSRLVVDPKNPDVVVKGGLFGSLSRDGGKTFSNMGSMHPDIHDVTFSSVHSDHMFVATDGGVYRTWDGGSTMEIVANIPVSQFYHVSLDDAEPYNVYGGLQDNGSWYGPSQSPGGIEARDWESIGQGDGFRVVKHATKNIMISEMQGAENVWRYDADKKTVKSIQPLPEKGDPKLRFNWNTPILFSQHKPDRFYIGSQFLHRSEDIGDTWKKISPDLTTNDPAKQNQSESGGLSKDNSGAENHTTIFAIAESPLSEKILWVGTDDGLVQVTQDGGKIWNNVTPPNTLVPSNTWVHHIEASVHGKGIAYAVFDGHTKGDKNPYVLKTSDFGKTWVSISTPDIKGFARSIQEDFVNPNLLFLGTEMGLFVTIDGGARWIQFTKNMPSAPVFHLELHKRTNDLVMATHGRGIIIVDDISPLRQLTAEVFSKDVHFFNVPPTAMIEENGFGGYSTEMEYVGPNPDRNARILYYLKKRPLFGKSSLQIFDASGKQVADLPPSKLKGINVVSWNFRLPPPKVATGKTFTFGGFASPRVPAGDYKVVLNIGKERHETTLKLEYDKQSKLSKKERQQLHEMSMELYAMSEELAYQVYRLDTWMEALQKAPHDKAEYSAPAQQALTRIKEKLVVTTGDNYVGAAEPQLREKLAELFSKLVGSFNPPSAAEIANKALLTETMNTELAELENVIADLKGKLAEPAIKSKAEFLAP